MPELPEVETVKRGLSPFLAGRKIVSVEKTRPDLRWPIPGSLEPVLTGARVLKLERRGKYILWHTQDEMVMILHLGMSGRVLITRDLPKVKNAHDHLTFKTEDGIFIRYNDPRRFGFVDVVPLKNLAEYPSLAALGPEPLSNAFNASALRQKINKKQSPIKSVLLDQTVIAGLGNIYACEALHRSGISPRRKAKNISENKIDGLVIAIRIVLQDAINAGGSTLKDHLQTTGEMGYFQHQFRVYSRAGEGCMKKSCLGTIKRIIQSGRSTFFCGKCQR
tara:strand:- start:151 stop:981 length:831 start_codon:yes stop_codon:yes gene_type:complete